ncbi:hypothetical protein Nepgr_032125 [Nepenthes gracilis]|uniref:Fe2OG dioxygenase domain-containing protein n=1 Tax=Nepenthes gracilis TaxID=150966 RepID=A0AAD3Y5E6_NEPGR|nr:hypothetical protein Nepgr_032125 [Nepenthes gracilis]
MEELDYSMEALDQLTMMESEPPFEETYKELFENYDSMKEVSKQHDMDFVAVEEAELPLIDLQWLREGDGVDREECKREMEVASKEWGFFQVVNHGISGEILEGMRREQVRVFREPFYRKEEKAVAAAGVDVMSLGSYRWGTPTATCLQQLSWSEAFHISLIEIPYFGGITSFSSVTKRFAEEVSELAKRLANILVERMGDESTFLKQNCLPSTCYLRMNRYPPCPKYSHVFDLMPHTYSDFLMILCQDQVGGLQLVKDGKWISVKPNLEALIVNIGDLFQVWSNGVYKSVEHRVVANQKMERGSLVSRPLHCDDSKSVDPDGAGDDEATMDGPRSAVADGVGGPGSMRPQHYHFFQKEPYSQGYKSEIPD